MNDNVTDLPYNVIKFSKQLNLFIRTVVEFHNGGLNYELQKILNLLMAIESSVPVPYIVNQRINNYFIFQSFKSFEDPTPIPMLQPREREKRFIHS